MPLLREGETMSEVPEGLEELLPEDFADKSRKFAEIPREQVTALCEGIEAQEWAELLDWYDKATADPAFLPFGIKLLTRNPACISNPADARIVIGLAGMALKKLITDYDIRKAELKELQDEG